jgi:hypothetical protein
VGISYCDALKAVGYLAKRREISFAVENCLLLETIDPELVTQSDREERVWAGGSDLVWEGVLPGLGPKAAR